MSNNSKRPEKDPVEKDTRKKTEATLNRDIHKNLQKERFPESTMAKDSRADAEKAEKVRDHADGEKASADDDTTGMVGSRVTSSSADDLAGVADIDKGLKRAERHTHD